MTKTRQQHFATRVYARIQPLIPANPNAPTEAERKRNTAYGSMAHKLPMLIHQAGLIQALTFVAARGNDHHQQLLTDLAIVLNFQSSNALLHEVRTAELSRYMHLTTEAQQALIWFKRLVQSVLDVDVTAEATNAA